MDHLQSLRLFVRVVERQSFSAAASDLGLSRSTATEAIKQLERTLGSRLLDRTTRHVRPTLDGEQYYGRCVGILADLDDAEAVLRDATPHGRLRIDAPGLLTRTFIVPHLPAFLARYPRIQLQLGQTDRLVDLVREGVDCAIRVGQPIDSGLTLKRLGLVTEITVASPAYLERHGVPRHPDELEGHQMVGFLSSLTGGVLPLEFTVAGGTREATLPVQVSANHSDTTADLARQGLGLVQAPRYRFLDDLATGRLVEVLGDFLPTPTPVFALYPHSRDTAPRLRSFLDFITNIFAEANIQ